MCGRCRNVFNAFQSLTRIAESDASPQPSNTTPPMAERDRESPPSLSETIFLREEPSALPQEFTQTDYDSDIQTPVTSELVTFLDHETPAPHVSHDLPSLSGLSPLPRSNAVKPDAEGLAENPLLAAIPGHRAPRATVRASRWLFASTILFLGLGVQVAYGYRSTITQSFPELRPAFVWVCDWAGCGLSWGREEGKIGIEASDLIETPGKAGRILLTATLANRGPTRQDLPLIELKLTDNANQVILSRVLRPEEYMGRMPGRDENLAPNMELYVNLSLELATKAQASGYGVRAFYD